MTLPNSIISELLIALGLVFMVSCNESNPGSVKLEQPPQVPSAKSMAIDLSIFTSEQPDSNSTGNHEHYQAAAQSISTIQEIMDRSINLSLDLLSSADAADAEELSEGKWQWTFANDEQKGRLIYDVRLVAEQQREDELKWDLFLSSPVLQNSDEKLFISGVSNIEVTEGVWTYYSFDRTGQPGQKIAELDWELGENEDVDMELEILASNLSGSEMEYHAEGAVRTIELNAANDEEETVIEFNIETNAGFIISPDYNNGNKACWDSHFKNIDCSET